jgi:hypothetical protein
MTMKLHNLLIQIAIPAVVSVASAVLVSHYALEKYSNENPTPQISVIDIEGYVKSKIDNGEDPAKVLRYVGLLTTAAVAENMLVLDKKVVVASHPDYDLPMVSAEALENRLRELGKPVPSLDEFEAKLNKSKQQMTKTLDEIDQMIGK